MKINNQIIALLLSIVAVIGGVSLVGAVAQPNTVTDQQIEYIRGNCVSIKNTLGQLHASDALLRVNMGQIYESMLTKLMTRFDSRVLSNNFSNTSLVFATTNFSLSLNSFRLDYQAYEEQLSATLKIDCSAQPSQFYSSIQVARTKRNQVHADVLKLIQYTKQYKMSVDKFEKDYQKISAGGNQ